MVFPIGDDQVVGGARPIFSYSFIVINVVVFLAQFALTASQGTDWLNRFFVEFGALPVEITRGQDLHTLFTSIFIHGGWMHLIGNMLFLWVFADNIESTIGNVNFLLFYLLGGLAASLTHIYLDPNSAIPGIGASGAISACLGAYLILYPKSRIKMIVLFLFSSFRIPALLFLVFWIGQQLLTGIGSLSETTSANEGVAWWAHIGGFAFGLIAGFLIRKIIKPLDLNVQASGQLRT